MPSLCLFSQFELMLRENSIRQSVCSQAFYRRAQWSFHGFIKVHLLFCAAEIHPEIDTRFVQGTSLTPKAQPIKHQMLVPPWRVITSIFIQTQDLRCCLWLFITLTFLQEGNNQSLGEKMWTVTSTWSTSHPKDTSIVIDMLALIRHYLKRKKKKQKNPKQTNKPLNLNKPEKL